MINIDKEKLLATIDNVVKRTMRMDLPWEWPCGVAYYGILKAYSVTAKEEYLELIKKRIDEYIELGLPDKWNVNTCSMGHTMITLYEATGDEKYWEIALSKLDYLQKRALRFANNVIQHTVNIGNDFPEQAWADTLFMAAYFMLRMSKKLNDKALFDDGLNQFYWHIKYLQNPETGLWYHGYDHINKNHMSGFYWARANAWAAYTMSQVGGYLQEAFYLIPQFMDVASSLNEQLCALKSLQTANGLWRTLLDDEESYEELSASCGIAAAMTCVNNPLHRKYIIKAYDGVLGNITADGRVLNVSGGTAVMKDRDGYRNISRDWIQGWGQGLALTFLSTIMEKYGGTECENVKT